MSLFFSAYIVALAVQWKLALITMSIVPAIILAIGGCVGIDAPIEARIVRIYSQAATVAQDALGSIKTITAFGAQPKIVNWYDEYLKTAHKEAQKKSLIYGVLYSSQTFLTMAGTALAFWQGFRMYQSGEIRNVGTVFTVVLSVTLGATSVLLFLPQIGAITNASSAAAELFSIIDKPSDLDPLSPDGKRPDVCTGEIEFRDLNFAYPARAAAPVLQGFNLSIPAGKTTALVGPSGCGKSTLVGLLERWYSPTSGQILLDGVDLADLNTNWLRSNIRLVQQEPTLFQGSVFQNVAKGLVGEQLDQSEEKQMQLVQEACRAADAHTFIEKLPQRYHTQLGEGAGMLSGGQRQRISIARSIVAEPKILLCDEATSALDPRSEKVVQDALNRVSAGKTTLVIAHKLATVMAADKIAVMVSGKIVEQGSHHELISLDGLYASMVRAQDLGAEAREQDSSNEGPHHDDIPDQTVDPRSNLQPKQTELVPKTSEDRNEHLTAGTLRYSLVQCIFTMLKENSALYGWYSLIALAYLMVGKSFMSSRLAQCLGHVLTLSFLLRWDISSSSNPLLSPHQRLYVAGRRGKKPGRLLRPHVLCLSPRQPPRVPLHRHRQQHYRADPHLPLSSRDARTDDEPGPGLLRLSRELFWGSDRQAVFRAGGCARADVGKSRPHHQRSRQHPRHQHTWHSLRMAAWSCSRLHRTHCDRWQWIHSHKARSKAGSCD